MTVPIGVLGGGAFGRAIATAAARAGRDVILRTTHPVELGPRVRTTSSFGELSDTELILVAVPSIHVSTVARDLAPQVDGSHYLVHVSRGLVGPELRTLSQILRSQTPVRRVGAIAGPLVAQSLLEGKPSGAIVGSLFPEVAEAVRAALGSPSLLLWTTDDVVGIEVASALVGLLVLGIGYAQTLDLGPGILGVIGTRGMVEASRVGRMLGAEEQAFGGLAGVGDLIAAVAGDERPELRLGQALGRKHPLEAAVRDAGANVEAVSLAQRVAAFCERKAIDAPILCTLADLITGKLTSADAVARLMGRRAD